MGPLEQEVYDLTRNDLPPGSMNSAEMLVVGAA